MKLEFTARQTQIPEKARKLAERKLDRIGRLLDGATRAHIVVTAEGHRRIVEITVYSRRLTVSALEQSNDIGLSLAAAVLKLERQVEKHRGRRESLRQATSVRGTSPRRRPAEKAPRSQGTPRRRAVVAPEMTMGMALAAVEAEGENMVVYRDSKTDRLSVLYRRKDGKVGLIEPE